MPPPPICVRVCGVTDESIFIKAEPLQIEEVNNLLKKGDMNAPWGAFSLQCKGGRVTDVSYQKVLLWAPQEVCDLIRDTVFVPQPQVYMELPEKPMVVIKRIKVTLEDIKVDMYVVDIKNVLRNELPSQEFFKRMLGTGCFDPADVYFEADVQCDPVYKILHDIMHLKWFDDLPPQFRFTITKYDETELETIHGNMNAIFDSGNRP